MKVWGFLATSGALILSGCAFPTHVQRFGVDYNEALASMANEQTLLNVLRASKGMPSHFTSVSRFTGTLAMKASASMNGQLRGTGLTSASADGTPTKTTNTTQVVNGGNTTTTTAVETTSGFARSAVEGVDLYTPQMGGELNSGTTFDVQVFDQQKFYQGILSSVPFSTVELLINQGFERDLVANLLIARVDFYVQDPTTKNKVGAAVATYINDATDRVRFQKLMDCNRLDVAETRTSDTKLIPIKRLELGTAAGQERLTLAQLSLFDGDKFALSDSAGISANGSTDDAVYVVKPGAKSRIAQLIPRSCASRPEDEDGVPSQAVYLGEGIGLTAVTVKGVTSAQQTPLVMEIVFRSPEGAVRAVGDIVRDLKLKRPSTLTVGVCAAATSGTDCAGSEKLREPIFSLASKRDRTELIGTRFMNEDYSVPAGAFRSMQVITILQQLINLQKESSDRALSIPVRAVP